MFRVILDNWDSKKFNFKVGKLIKSDTIVTDYNSKDFRLLVAKINKNNSSDIEFLINKNFKVVCEELFLNRLENKKTYKYHKDIIINHQFVPNFQIEDFEMFYSRFYLDKKMRSIIGKDFWDKMIYEHLESFADRNFFVLSRNNLMLRGIISCKINNNVLDLFNVNIHKNYQGKGLGSMLIEKIINYSKEYDYKLTTSVISSNKKAIKLYKKYDFKIIDKYAILHKWIDK